MHYQANIDKAGKLLGYLPTHTIIDQALRGIRGNPRLSLAEPRRMQKSQSLNLVLKPKIFSLKVFSVTFAPPESAVNGRETMVLAWKDL